MVTDRCAWCSDVAVGKADFFELPGGDPTKDPVPSWPRLCEKHLAEREAAGDVVHRDDRS